MKKFLGLMAFGMICGLAYAEQQLAKQNTEIVALTAKAQQGDVSALYSLGRMYYRGEGVAQNYKEAAIWFQNAIAHYRKAAEQGDVSAQFKLGEMYRSGENESLKQDFIEAESWYRKAAEQYSKSAIEGKADAQFWLGLMYQNGMGVAKSIPEAMTWYRKAAEQGDVRAQFSIAEIYYNINNAEGIEKNDREAVVWYRKAADQGDASAQFRLGEMYRFGEGVTKNMREAMAWYRKAAAQGNWEANKAMDSLDARKSLSRKAEQGDASAMYNLGRTADDVDVAVVWFRKAADHGDARAQFRLGEMYQFGEGVIENVREAIIWYRKAAEQGNTAALNKLAELGDENAKPSLAKATQSGLKQACSGSIVSLVEKRAATTYLKDGLISSSVIASACKAWPNNNAITIVALAYGKHPDEAKALIVAIADNLKKEVIAIYKGSIEESAEMHVASNSLRIDTARYELAPGVRAFGIDVISGYIHSLAYGFNGPARTLFVWNGNTIRPVLQGFQTITSSVVEGCNPNCSKSMVCDDCNREIETVFENISYEIGIGKATSHGYSNLLITANISYSNWVKPKEGPFKYELHYDGKTYSAKPNADKEFANWRNNARPDKWKK